VGVSGGWEQRSTVHEVGDPETFIVFKDGFTANAALGVHIWDWRLEVETTFMNNIVNTAGAGGLSSPSAGNVNLRAYMLNLYRDFHCCKCRWVNPYLGAGIGIYQSELNGLNPEFFDQLGAPFANTPINATSDMPLAYQFRAGVSCPLTDRTDFFAGYRYFKGQELTFAAAPFASFSPTFHPDGAVINSVEMGIRVNF
jgi:opacity protein-like surface antigen